MRTPSSPSTLTSSPRAQVRPPTTRSTVVPGAAEREHAPLAERQRPRRRAGRSVPARRRSRSARRPAPRRCRGQPRRGHRSSRPSLLLRPRNRAPASAQPTVGAQARGRRPVADAQRDQPLALARPGRAVEHHRVAARAPASSANRSVVAASSTDATVASRSAAARNSVSGRRLERAGTDRPSASHSARHLDPNRARGAGGLGAHHDRRSATRLPGARR